MAPAPTDGRIADRIVVSYRPADPGTDLDDGWLADRLREDAYLAYLVRVHGGPVAVGDEWSEFVSRGCTAPRDVVLRVEAVEGGDTLGADTAFAFVPAGEAATA